MQDRQNAGKVRVYFFTISRRITADCLGKPPWRKEVRTERLPGVTQKAMG